MLEGGVNPGNSLEFPHFFQLPEFDSEITEWLRCKSFKANFKTVQLTTKLFPNYPFSDSDVDMWYLT